LAAIDKTALWKKVGYQPHDRQLLFHLSEARFKIPVCGRRFGKSKMAAMEALPELFIPDTQGWIVGPTYTLGAKEFAYAWQAFMDLGMLDKLKRKAFNEKTGDMYIEMPWGSRLDVKSADHPDSLVGEGLDYVIVSEAAKQRPSVWDKYLRPALADKAPRSWAAFPSTPEGQNWYYQLYRRGQRHSPEYNKAYESWNFPSWENPHVYPGGFEDPEIQDQLRTPDDPWFWQEIGADFRSFVGKIYTEWDDDTHIYEAAFNTDRYVYNPDWENFMFFDFGFQNPFVALDVQRDPSDNLYIWREYYLSGLPVHQHAMALRTRTNPQGYAIRCGYGDYADPAAIETLGSLLCPIWADKDSKDVNQGIQEVKKMLLDKTGTPHIYVSKDCPNTIWEFQNYKIKPSIRDEEVQKEAPKKWADHSMDAIRYGIMHLYVLGAKYHLSDVNGGYGNAMPQGPLAPVGLDPLGNPSDGDSYFTRDSGEAVFTLSGRMEF